MSTFTEIRESVVSLSKPERAELAVLLLGSLDDTHYWVDDEEVDQRYPTHHGVEEEFFVIADLG